MRIIKPFNVVDILPTLLGLAEVAVPATVEGLDHSPEIRGEPFEGNEASLLMSIAPFSDPRLEPWRGVRTGRTTYVRKLDGPWLLYDNREDPYQLENLVDSPRFGDLQRELDHLLNRMLAVRGDEFLPSGAYLDRFGYKVNETGAIPYTR